MLLLFFLFSLTTILGEERCIRIDVLVVVAHNLALVEIVVALVVLLVLVLARVLVLVLVEEVGLVSFDICVPV